MRQMVMDGHVKKQQRISGSDSDEERRVSAKPRPKRRRILEPSVISTVQIYSKKVDSSFKIQPLSFQPDGSQGGDAEDASPLPPVQKKPPASECIELSDSEEESERPKLAPLCSLRSPSPPPPPPSCSRLKACRRPNRKLLEINRKLDAIGSLLSPSPEQPGLVSEQDQPLDEEEYGDEDDDDDVVIVDPQKRPRVRPSLPQGTRQEARCVPLKFRCRTEILRIPLLTTAPLKVAMEDLSLKLKVPPSRLLLLRKEAELPATSTVSELGLGIADIIDCVVMSEESHDHSDGNHGDGESDVITVRFQGKEKGSQQEYTVGKREPLGSVLNRYASQLPPALRSKARFLFDGSKVSPIHTPFDLEMEDGDVIEVWF